MAVTGSRIGDKADNINDTTLTRKPRPVGGELYYEKAIIRNRHPELVSGSMGYRKSEMLKKFQHDSDIAKVSIFGYGLWKRPLLFRDIFFYVMIKKKS